MSGEGESMSGKTRRAFEFARRHPMHFLALAASALTGVSLLTIYVLSWFTVDADNVIRQGRTSRGLVGLYENFGRNIKVFGWLVVLYILLVALGSAAFLPLLMLSRVAWFPLVVGAFGFTVMVFYFVYVVDKTFPDSLLAVFKSIGAMPLPALSMTAIAGALGLWREVALEADGFGLLGSVLIWLVMAFCILIALYGRLDIEGADECVPQEDDEQAES